MGTRLRLLLVFLGALLVVVTFTYPEWRPPPVDQSGDAEFPELPVELQEAFQLLPETIRQGYLVMRRQNTPQAVALLSARLSSPLPQDQPLPPVEDARMIMDGMFGPIELQEDDERELPPFSELYSAAGEVSIYLFSDDRKLLRIDNLQVVNGPELYIALLVEPFPLTIADLGRDYQDWPLLSPKGNQNYEIPPELNIYRYRSVVIYDRRYGIIFAVAQIG